MTRHGTRVNAWVIIRRGLTRATPRTAAARKARVLRTGGLYSGEVTALPLILALLCASFFAISSSIQHHAAEGAPASARGLVGLLAYLVRRPEWLVGQFLATCAFALHASALHDSSRSAQSSSAAVYSSAHGC